MNPPDVNYSEKVTLLKEGGRTEMSLADAIRTVVRLACLGDRLACSIIRKGSPMAYAEIVRISERRDFPRHG